MVPGIALIILIRPVSTWGTGIGIVFVLVGWRITDGVPGVSGRGTSPGSVLHRARKEYSGYLFNATTQVSDNESVHYRQTYGDTGVTPSVTSHIHTWYA